MSAASVVDQPPTAPAIAPHRRRHAVGRWTTRVFAAIGVIAVVGLTLGTVADVNGFDQTRGGYDPPYEGWTGTPTDWSEQGVTSTGFRGSGYVLDTTFDCTTGMIAVAAFGASVNFRVVGERGILVHKPRQTCRDAGFTPEF